MADIVERLRFDSARCEMQFSKGVAGNIEEAAAEIERLRGMVNRSLPFLQERAADMGRGLRRLRLRRLIEECLPYHDEQTAPGGSDGNA